MTRTEYRFIQCREHTTVTEQAAGLLPVDLVGTDIKRINHVPIDEEKRSQIIRNHDSIYRAAGLRG